MSQTPGWLTPQHLAEMTGFSVSFIRSEIKVGELKATLVQSPSRPRLRGRWRITEADARAYCGRLGFHGDRGVDVVECAAEQQDLVVVWDGASERRGTCPTLLDDGRRPSTLGPTTRQVSGGKHHRDE